VGLIALDRVGAALAPWLATHHPLLLVAVDPSDKAILLALKVGMAALFPVALARRIVAQCLYFLIGRKLGPEAKAWLAGKGLGGVVGRFERLVGRWAYPAVGLVPREVVCLLAGDLGMGWAPFIVLAAARDSVVILLLRLLSHVFAAQINDVLNTLSAYTLPATLAAVGLVAAQVVWQRRRTVRRRRAVPAPAPSPAGVEADEAGSLIP